MANPRLMSQVTRRTRSGSPLWSMKSLREPLIVGRVLAGTTQITLRSTRSATTVMYRWPFRLVSSMLWPPRPCSPRKASPRPRNGDEPPQGGDHVRRPARRCPRPAGFWLGAADVFLETERKDFRMSGLEERERAVELYFTTPMTAQVVEASGLSDQAVSGALAGDGFPVCWPYGQTHHPTGDQAKGSRAGAGRHAAEAGRQTARRGRRRGAWLGQGVPQGRHGRVAAQKQELRAGQ